MEAGRGGDAGELPSVTCVQGWGPISQRRRLRCRMARRALWSRKPGIAPGPPGPACPGEGDMARLSSHSRLVPSWMLSGQPLCPGRLPSFLPRASGRRG